MQPQSSERPATLRSRLSAVDELDPWDPYLRGRKDVARARMLRSLNRHEDALTAYREAVRGRLPLQFWVELGLYEWELGYTAEARDHLKTVLDLRYHLGQVAQDPALRALIHEIGRPDG
ncbi:MAG TPA: hypothetical protein VMO47_11140 [Rhodothermales bacterium]|nr:hypothetical protein [Rhodothermales bacterium]